MKANYFTTLLLPLVAVTALGYPLFEPQSVQAQNNFVLFGGGKDSTLGYTIRSNRTSARLNAINFFAKLPKSKAIAEIQIFYPEGFASVFNPENVKIVDRNSRNIIEVKEAISDREIRSVRFVFKEPISASKSREIEIVSLGGSNPPNSGMYRIELQAIGTEANPLFQYIGQWLVNIS